MGFETGKLLLQHEFYRMVPLAGRFDETVMLQRKAKRFRGQIQRGRATLLCWIRPRDRDAPWNSSLILKL